MSDATAAIRQAIHDGPSRDEFTRIARAFDRLRPDEMASMLAFVEKHLDAWPHHLRVAPAEWWRRIARGEEVPGFRFARALELEGEGDPQAIADAPEARQLHHLAIRDHAIGDAGAAILARAPRLHQLESLALVNASIGPAGVHALQASLRSLSAIDLSGNALSPPAVEALLGAPDLSVAGCELGVDGARAIASSRRSEGLLALDLSENDVGDTGVAALAASGWLGNLTELDLAANALSDRAAIALAGAAWIPNLSLLDLSDNALELAPLWLRLGSITALRIARTRTTVDPRLLPALVELDASALVLSDEAIAAAASIRRLTLRDAALEPSAIGLLAQPHESLDLAGNPLTLGSIAALAQPPIESLDLSRCEIGDAGLALLARGPTMSSIHSLRLQHDGITPDGLSALLASERTIRLARIDLSDNPLGPEGAGRLAESDLIARLTRIHARNCGFTGDWIKTLRARAPHADIEG